MTRRIDLAAQNLLGTRHCQGSDLIPKHIPRALHRKRGLLFGSLPSGRHDTGAFGASLVKRLSNLALASRSNLSRARPRRGYFSLDPALCVG